MQWKEEFDRNGFVIIDNAFELQALTEFENTIIRLAEKLLQEVGAPEFNQYYEKLRHLCTHHKKEFYKLCSNVGGTLAGMRLTASPNFGEVITNVMGPSALDYFLMPFNIFFNDPGSERLKYDFHQEAGAFPTVKETYHIWTPLFRDLKDEDGPMVVLKGSHKKIFPFTSLAAPDSVTQLLIDPDLIKDYERISCSLKRGTAILFHQNLVHASGNNFGQLPRVSCAARFLNLTSEEKFEPYVHYYFSQPESRKAVEQGVAVKVHAKQTGQVAGEEFI